MRSLGDAIKKPNLELVMCLHAVAALYCSLDTYTEAIPFLERSVEIPVIDEGPNHALAKFAGLEIQRQILEENDPLFGETCRMPPRPLPKEEADRRLMGRLMGLILDSKGDHEAALEHYVLASMAMAANRKEIEVASTDCNIGDSYLSLARYYYEAIFVYQKSLATFKSTKGENHPSVASVFVRLADL
ncbi:tetratricopeptide repeat (TPR)-like superfamily protein [Actinidia rufa]|uniref:Tetratricopeptide repeat (TPR)-like superfamily protein n=1 Tax=Actinidia rufa TaxID=165716 RepID=A0A7J0EL67_9ERIC|nr:tetratricopeptide repeat (TPR)-like superfamily protein [Actinidia rufa]